MDFLLLLVFELYWSTTHTVQPLKMWLLRFLKECGFRKFDPKSKHLNHTAVKGSKNVHLSKLSPFTSSFNFLWNIYVCKNRSPVLVKKSAPSIAYRSPPSDCASRRKIRTKNFFLRLFIIMYTKPFILLLMKINNNCICEHHKFLVFPKVISYQNNWI